MSQSVTLNGVVFSIPDVGDEDWGQDVTDYLVALPTSVVQLSGNQTLTGSITFANQKGIRFSELTANGTNYIEVVAPDSVTANTTLKLPDGAGSAGQVLSTDGSGVLSWINAAGGGTINSGTAGRLAIYAAATTVDDIVTLTNTVRVDIATQGQASVYTIPDAGAATASFVMTEGAQTINGAKTLSGATVISNNSIAAFTISQADSFKVDSTNALVSIGTATMTYPLYVSKSSAGANVTIAVENTESANGASHARLYVVTGGASGGDPFATFYNGVQNYSIGLDNSDSDALCVTGAATLNGTNLLRLTTAGALTVASTLTVTAGGAVITAGGLVVTAGGVSLSADALTIAKTTNQIILGTTNTVTITSPAPASSAVYTIPDVGTAASFILTTGAQTITGAKTFASSTLLLQEAGSTDVVTVAVAALAASRIYTVPDAGGAASFVMTAGTQTIAGTTIFSATTGNRYHGDASNSAVAAGDIGEIIESTYSAVSYPSTGTYSDATSINLTAGKWIVFHSSTASANGSTHNQTRLGISTTSGNSSSGLVDGDTMARGAGAVNGVCGASLTVVALNIKLSGTTTYYAKLSGDFTVATPTASGRITAIRIG